MTLTLNPLDSTGTLDAARSETAFDAAVRAAGDQFAVSTAEHQMDVALDATALGGVHRHLTFATPGSSLWRYSLVTYPGHLVVSGDLETFVFRAAYDMIAFFTAPSGSRHFPVHPSYWAEKVAAGKVLDEFSNPVFTEHINQRLDEVRDAYAPHNFAAIRERVDADLLAWGFDYVFQAREALDDFTVELVDEPDFRFVDTKEWVFTGYNHHYLVACHAIATGARRYLAGGGLTVRDPRR